VRRVSRPAAP